MIEGLQQDSEGENHRTGKESQRKRCLVAFGKLDAIEANSDNDQQHGQTDPVAMNVHLAVVDIFGFPVVAECGFGSGRISACGSIKGRRQGRTNAIQRLMLGKNGVPQAVAPCPTKPERCRPRSEAAGRCSSFIFLSPIRVSPIGRLHRFAASS